MPPKKTTESPRVKRPPSRDPETRENQLIAAAMNLAEQQIADGTASSQVISHFLRLGSMKQQLENEKLRQENALLKAKTESLERDARIEEMYDNAIKAMSMYQGNGESDDYDEDIY